MRASEDITLFQDLEYPLGTTSSMSIFSTPLVSLLGSLESSFDEPLTLGGGGGGRRGGEGVARLPNPTILPGNHFHLKIISKHFICILVNGGHHW